MDPALQELVRSTAADQEVEAILRLTDPAARIPGVRVVSRFGSIVTCRLPAHSILETRDLEQVASVKAPRLLGPEASGVGPVFDLQQRPSDIRRPSGVRYTGRVVVGFLDWGFSFANAAFRRPDGRTRLLALWDQRARDPAQPNRYGYGIIHREARLNSALRSRDPYAALGYHPAESDSARLGAHGSVTADIAVGNGRGGSPIGLAPEADIVCVHLATETRGTSPLETLGDSSRVLESIDFIRRTAGGRPFVVSASIGRHGGPHDGTTLVEAAEDTLADRPNCVVIHSGGNYASRRIHSSGHLRQGQTRVLRLKVDSRDRTGNEIEVWYSGASRFSVCVEWPDGARSHWITLGERAELARMGSAIGRVYHRARDPQNGDSLVDIFLDADAPSGEWGIVLRAESTPSSGAGFHAWIERDDLCAPCQACFSAEDADPSVTTSTLANARRTISVGAVNAHDQALPIAPFSSAGPTRDGRVKPDCVAPGVDILAVRSPWFGEADTGQVQRRSGTSMAAPFVAGCAALVLEAGGGLLGPDEAREIILTNTDDASGADRNRYGRGYVNVERAIAAAERVARRRATPPSRSFVYAGEDLMEKHKETRSSKVEIATRFLGGRGSESADGFLRALAGDRNGEGLSRSALRLFRDVREGVENSVPATPGEGITVVARPGEHFDGVRTGDVVLRRPLGEGSGIHVAVVAGPEVSQDQLGAAGLTPEDGGRGWFAQVIEGGARPHGLTDRFARRTRDSEGRNTADQAVIRLERASEVPEEAAILSALPTGASEALGETSTDIAAAVTRSWDRCQALSANAASATNPNKVNGDRILLETGIKVDANPYVGITKDEIDAVTRASQTSRQRAEVLLAIWAKEGSTNSVTSFRRVPSASTEANARTLFRCRVYYQDLGADHFILTTRSGSGDNAYDDSDTAASGHEAHFVAEVRKLVKNGFLPQDISDAINTELVVRDSGTDFEVRPTIRFYALSLLLVDALFSQLEGLSHAQLASISPAMNYLQWNMGPGRFKTFLESADLHRKEPAFRNAAGTAPTIEEWALHTPPRAHEWHQSRVNAIKFLHYLESYRPLFVGSVDAEASSAPVSPGGTTRFTPSRSDSIVVAGAEYVPDGLKVRNWAASDVDQFDRKPPIYRPIHQIRAAVLHETRGKRLKWEPRIKRSLENRDGFLAIHGYVDIDGTLIQHNDLTELLAHGGDTANAAAVGFEIISPMIRDNAPAHAGDVIDSTWDRGKTITNQGHYLVPPSEQLEGVVSLIRWLNGPPLNISGWAGIQTAGGQDLFTVIPWRTGAPRPLEGVIGHGQYIRAKSDGVFPALYVWLRLEAAFEPEEALNEAKLLLSQPNISTITLPGRKWRGTPYR